MSSSRPVQDDLSTSPIDFAMLWRGKWTLLACAAVSVAAGLIYMAVAAPVFEAQARVLVDPRGSMLSQESALGKRVDPEFLPTQVETIRSPITVADALSKVDITPPWDADPVTYDPVREVLKSLKVTPVLRANVLTVTYSSAQPDEAVALISAIVDSYTRHVSAMDNEAASRTIELLAASEREVRKELEAAQKEYRELRQASPLFGQGQVVVNEAMKRLDTINVEVAAARQRRLTIEVQLNSLTAALGDGQQPLVSGSRPSPGRVAMVSLETAAASLDDELIQEILRRSQRENDHSTTDVERELRAARVRREQLDARLGPRHPDMIAANAEVAELEREWRLRLDATVGVLERELDSAKHVETRLNEEYQVELGNAKETDKLVLDSETLHANITNLEKLHSSALARLLEAQAVDNPDESEQSIVVRILDGPMILEEMTWPKPKVILPVSMAFGLVLGIGLVCVMPARRRDPVVEEV